MPVWCCSIGCTGTGAWFTKAGSNMPAPQNVLRCEYNWNGDFVWYNLSGVDGVNANVSMQYSSCDEETHCNVDFARCPFTTIPAGKGWTCGSTKVDANCKSCSSFGSFSPCQLAGCGYSDPATMCTCRKWWRDNHCALEWCNWIRQGDCNMYCWAYDELTLDPDAADCAGQTHPNPQNPLRRCNKTKEGNLVVSIKEVF